MPKIGGADVGSMTGKRFTVIPIIVLMLLSSWSTTMFSPSETDLGGGGEEIPEKLAISARAVTSWSGNVWLNDSYTVAITDELVITSCTQIWMDVLTRIYVDGRLTVEGTTACPAKLHSQGVGDHWGIRFNSTSNGRGSVVDNLTINNAIYGITVFSSNPILNNITVNNADDVGIDLYDGASPRINDLVIEEAGQDFIATPSYWRYGIGMSVGNYSTPIVNRATMNTLVTSGLNFWGNAGGLFNNITIRNVTGGINAISVGVWVMDSRPLIQDLLVERCDSGIYVRHYDDDITTRAVMRRVTIEDSMYRGLKIDKYDGTNYTNYPAAVITDLTIRGTGGPGAKTQGLGQAALEVNASGMWLEGASITDNEAPGIRLYFVDWNTEAYNVTIERSGKGGANAHAAGLTVRSSYFAPKFNDLSINDSAGAGIWSWGGGALQGSGWNLFNNTDEGLYIDAATVAADSLELHGNGRSAVRVEQGRNVELSNVNSSNNGDSATGPDGGAGFVFIESNDIESQSGDVRCMRCSSISDNWGGVWAKDSVDLILEEFEIHDPDNDVPAIVVDNGGLSGTQQGGWVDMIDIHTWTNGTANALKLDNAAAQINGLEMSGTHAGLHWNGDHNLALFSNLSNAELSGSGTCLDLSDHSYLLGSNINLTADCTGTITLANTQANWSGLADATGAHALVLDASSDMRLHQPNNVDMSLATLAGNAAIGVAWDYGIWVVNQVSKGIPDAEMSVTFDQLNQDHTYDSAYIGYDFFPNYLGQVWTSAGAGPHTTVDVDCEYDNTTNSTSTTLDQDRVMYCRLDLANQAPFIIWSTPQYGEQFSSGGTVIFNSTDSWDLEPGALNSTWTSSIDGDLFAGCYGGQGWGQGSNGHDSWMYLETNVQWTGWFCPLSDGEHVITLEVCDYQGLCSSEQRTIELTNQPPIISVDTSPPVDADGVLRVPWTQLVQVDANATYDPEGDQLQTTISASGCFSGDGWWNGNGGFSGTEMEWNITFAEAISYSCALTLSFSDGVNPVADWIIQIELDNELPNATFVVERAGNASENIVTLDGSATFDPEGDFIQVQWISSLDGLLFNGSGNESLIWNGYLSKGQHTISLYVGDNAVENAGLWDLATEQFGIDNSPPHAMISSPGNGSVVDSSTLLTFTASGTGDWDSWCGTFPDVDGAQWYCSPVEPTGGSDFFQVRWESNISGLIAEDYLNWSGRLAAGNHTITLTVDDGLSQPAVASMTIDVAQSAPVLGLFTPSDGDLFTSDEEVSWDASGSIDYDGDNFTMTVLDEEGNELLSAVDSIYIYNFRLSSGLHTLSVILADATGLNSTTAFTFEVYESRPYAAMTSPENGRDYPPATTLTLSANASVDWDNDISTYDWYIVNNTLLEEIDCGRWCEVNLPPGDYHIALLVKDTRGDSDWAHANISLLDSAPKFNESSLWVSDTHLVEGELQKVTIRVEIFDGDGTLQNVEGKITHGIQSWEFIMNDAGEGRDEIAGDGIWTAQVEIQPEGVGRPFMRILAIDELSVGQSEPKVDQITADFIVESIDDGFGATEIGGAIGGIFLLIVAINLFIGWRRRRLASLDVIESWTSFSDVTTGVDQASVVEAEIERSDTIEEGLLPTEGLPQQEAPTGEVADVPSMLDLGEGGIDSEGKDLVDIE